MQLNERELVWSFNRRLPFLSEAHEPSILTDLSNKYSALNNARHIVTEYYSFLEKKYSVPLKLIIDELYDDLNVPLDIVKIISIYNTGGITYDYTKSFENIVYQNKVVYISPIILGYIETISFVTLFILELCFLHSSNNLQLQQSILCVASLYCLVLFIHAICVVISFHKCKQYEKLLRNFKQYLYGDINVNNDICHQMQNMEEIEHERMKLIPAAAKSNIDDEKHIGININTGDKHDHEEEEDIHLSSVVLNPSNNSFAYVGYQRWLNVKKLQLSNDEFTRSQTTLIIHSCKYWLTMQAILSLILIVTTHDVYNGYISTIVKFWWGISCMVLFYCHMRIIEQLSLCMALKWVPLSLSGYFLVFGAADSIQMSDNKNSGDNGSWVQDIILPIFTGFLAFLFGNLSIGDIFKIKKRQTDGYMLWIQCVMFFGMSSVTLLIPTWRVIEIGILCVFFGLVSFYLQLQLLSHRIMTSLNANEYIAKFCTNNPRKWLIDEIKMLVVPYVQHDKLQACQEMIRKVIIVRGKKVVCEQRR